MFDRIFRRGLLATVLALLPVVVLAQGTTSFIPNTGGFIPGGTSSTFTTPILLPNGSAAAPALSFSSDPDSGIYRSNPNELGFATGGAGYWILNGANVRALSSTGYYSFNDDTFIYRDAANTLALRNTTNAQTFNIYNTYTDASNYERGAVYWNLNTLYIGTQNAGTGTARTLQLVPANGIVLVSATLRPGVTDTYTLGASFLQWTDAHFSRSIQGSKSKALTDNTATAFVRLSVADDDYEGCGVIYTAFAEDTATDARQTRTGKVYAAILNNSGTEAVAFSTGDSAVSVTAGTFTCTFDGASAVADTIDLRATCDTSLAATTTLTFEYRLDCPSTVTVTPQ